MKEKMISLRVSEDIIEQIEDRRLFYKIGKSEYIIRCIKENANPIDLPSVIQSLCNITTEINLYNAENERNEHVVKIRKEINQLWQYLK